MVRRITDTRQRVKLFLGITVAACGAYACQTSGIEQLTDTAPRNIYFPGKAIGTVQRTEVPVQMLGADGVPSAIVTRDMADQLHVYAFEGGKSCSLGPVAPLDDPIGWSVLAPLERYLPFQVRLDASNTELHLADDHCREPIGPFANATVIGSPSQYQPESLVILTNDERLLRFLPKDSSFTVIAKHVQQAQLSDGYLFTLENRTVTLRDQRLKKVRVLGTSVTQLRVGANDTRFAYIEKHGLYYASSATNPALLADTDACYVDWVDAPKAVFALQYEASCTNSTLVVNLVQLGQRLELPPRAQKPLSLRDFGTKASPDWVISYFAKPKDPTIAEPFVTAPNGSSFVARRRFIGRINDIAVEVGLARTVRSFGSVAHGKALLWLDPGTTQSRLVAWSPSQQSTYLRQVVDFTEPRSLIRAVAGTEGSNSLIAVDPGQKPTHLLDNVNDMGRTGNRGALLFSDVTTEVGQVSFLAPGGDSTEHLFDSAYVPSARLIWDDQAASALAPFSLSKGRGTLCVRLIESADTFCQPNVRGYAPTLRPALGIAYVSEEGGKSTLRWAEAR